MVRWDEANRQKENSSPTIPNEIFLTLKTIKKASLEDIRGMAEAGKLYHDPKAPAGGEQLDAEFWRDAQVVRPTEKPQSVHLKLDREVFGFFKSQGKGHLTRMQNVLRAYMLAHTVK